jgi:N-acyl homoserine lactone hydrolase
MKHGPASFEHWLRWSFAMALTAVVRVSLYAAEVPVVRLYVFDNGTITGINPTAFGMRKEDVATTDMVATSYLIVHPKGTLLWDTGVVPDEAIEAGETQFRTPGYLAVATKSLESQLASVGLAKQEVTYIALSHFHLDHTGNANGFTASTWLVQKPEHEAMLAESREHVRARYAALMRCRTRLLDGDLDVFDDGTTIIKAAYGHTPGHQVLQVNLRNTGVVVLAGDLYHYQEQRTSRVAPKGANPAQLAASRAAIEALIKSTGGQLWLAHDRQNFQHLKKAPAYYD